MDVALTSSNGAEIRREDVKEVGNASCCLGASIDTLKNVSVGRYEHSAFRDRYRVTGAEDIYVYHVGL